MFTCWRLVKKGLLFGEGTNVQDVSQIEIDRRQIVNGKDNMMKMVVVNRCFHP